MIDKMVNCTADECQDSTDPVYGDYMDDMETIVLNAGTNFNGVVIFKWRIGVLGAPIVV